MESVFLPTSLARLIFAGTKFCEFPELQVDREMQYPQNCIF